VVAFDIDAIEKIGEIASIHDSKIAFVFKIRPPREWLFSFIIY
jgi:hypothetical protein